MKEFQIGKNEAGQRFDKYLRKLLPDAPGGFLYKMLRKKNIVLNGKKAEGFEHLAVGDNVKLYLSDETFEKFSAHNVGRERKQAQETPPRLPVIYEDTDILAVVKPAGMLSQKAAQEDVSANEAIIHYLLESGALREEDLQTFRPSVCNRLDRNTSGILLAGKTLHGLQELSGQLKRRSIEKYYRCIVAGAIGADRHLRGYLCKDAGKNQVTVYQTDRQPPQTGSRYIETYCQTVRQYQDYAMLEVTLITGRTHQIRAHLASVGHPVIGDPKYGDAQINAWFRKKFGLGRQLLHAYRFVLENGTAITAPLPEDFRRIAAALEAI